MLWFSGFCFGMAAGILTVSIWDHIDRKKGVEK